MHQGSVTFCRYTPKSGLWNTEDPTFKAKMQKKKKGEYVEPDKWKPESWAYPSELMHESTEKLVIYHVPLEKSPWPLPGVPAEPGDIRADMRQYVYDHVDLPHEGLYDVVTAWILATWLVERWIAVPYIMALGPIKSGKTRLLEVLKALGYRGFMSSNVSEAALFRITEAWKPTILLDESEIYSKEGRTEIINLMNSGYRRGQWAIRIEKGAKGEFTPKLFDVFGFKAIAGTKPLTEALGSRSIQIFMEKNVRPVARQLDEERATELRSRLLLWRWRNLWALKSFDIFDVFDINPGVLEEKLKFADGRFAELYTPLITIAGDSEEAILEYARHEFSELVEEEGTTTEAVVLKAILKCEPSLEMGRFRTSEVTKHLNEGLEERDRWKVRSVGRIVKAMGFRARTMPDGSARGWQWDSRKVERLRARYNVSGETSKTSKMSNGGSLDAYTLQEDLERVLQGLRELEQQEGGEAVYVGDLQDFMGWEDLEELTRIMEILARDGLVFQPRPLHYKTTGGG